MQGWGGRSTLVTVYPVPGTGIPQKKDSKRVPRCDIGVRGTFWPPKKNLTDGGLFKGYVALSAPPPSAQKKTDGGGLFNERHCVPNIVLCLKPFFGIYTYRHIGHGIVQLVALFSF